MLISISSYISSSWWIRPPEWWSVGNFVFMHVVRPVIKQAFVHAIRLDRHVLCMLVVFLESASRDTLSGCLVLEVEWWLVLMFHVARRHTGLTISAMVVGLIWKRWSACWLSSGWARFSNVHDRIMNRFLYSMFDGLNSAFSVETVLDHVVSQYKLIKFLLQVVVLKSKDICMIL